QARGRFLELAVDGAGAADESHRGRSRTEAVEPFLPGGNHLRVIGESEVVVGGKDEDLAAPFHLHARRLGRIEVVEVLVHPVAAERLDLLAQPGLEGIHDCTSRITLPAEPSLMTAIASAIRSRGKRWVITGL